MGRAHGLDGTVRVDGAVDWFAYGGGATPARRRASSAASPRRAGGERRAAAHPLRRAWSRATAPRRCAGRSLELPAERLPEPEEDAFWVFDLVGCAVAMRGPASSASCARCSSGPRTTCWSSTASDGELLVPFTRDAVPEVDVTARRLEVAAWLLDAPIDDRVAPCASSTSSPSSRTGSRGCPRSGRSRTRSRPGSSSASTRYRDYSPLKHRAVDDAPFGGGAGMVLRVDVVAAAIEGAYGAPLDEVRAARRIVALDPGGRPLDDAYARELAAARRA